MSTDSPLRHTRLQQLSETEYHMTDGQPDVRGWDVVNANNEVVGNVEDLIFDIQAKKVRYIALTTISKGEQQGKQVLVPIGVAAINTEEKKVELNSVTNEQLLSLPEYDEARFDSASEESVHNVFGGLGASALHGGAGSPS